MNVDTITSKEGVVRPHAAARFLCWSRWRCLICDSPWFAASDAGRAWERYRVHVKAGCPR